MTSKNNMPTFVDTSYDNLERALKDKKVNPPIFGFCNDLQCMVYVSPNGEIYKILVDRISEIEKQLVDLKDVDTGEIISVKEYVEKQQETVVPNVVEEIKNTGGVTVMLTSKEGGVMDGI